MTGVYLEIGKRRLFACAVEWPGWARAGRDQDLALAALAGRPALSRAAPHGTPWTTPGRSRTARAP